MKSIAVLIATATLLLVPAAASASNRFKFLAKTALWFNPVMKNHDIWIKRHGNTITGRMRLQFSFLAPKFTPGTFTIYSCLGGATFAAQPKR